MSPPNLKPETPVARKFVPALLLFAVVVGLWLAWSPDHLPPPRTVKADAAYAAYVGSASCAECHPEAHKKWAGSHHAEAERLVQTNRDWAAFTPARIFPHGTQKTFVQWHPHWSIP